MTQDESRRYDWTNKPQSEWTDEDWADYGDYQTHRKPIRFQFGSDATEEDIDKFLDQIFGPKPDNDTDDEGNGKDSEG